MRQRDKERREREEYLRKVRVQDPGPDCSPQTRAQFDRDREEKIREVGSKLRYGVLEMKDKKTLDLSPSPPRPQQVSANATEAAARVCHRKGSNKRVFRVPMTWRVRKPCATPQSPPRSPTRAITAPCPQASYNEEMMDTTPVTSCPQQPDPCMSPEIEEVSRRNWSDEFMADRTQDSSSSACSEPSDPILPNYIPQSERSQQREDNEFRARQRYGVEEIKENIDCYNLTASPQRPTQIPSEATERAEQIMQNPKSNKRLFTVPYDWSLFPELSESYEAKYNQVSSLFDAPSNYCMHDYSTDYYDFEPGAKGTQLSEDFTSYESKDFSDYCGYNDHISDSGESNICQPDDFNMPSLSDNFNASQFPCEDLSISGMSNADDSSCPNASLNFPGPSDSYNAGSCPDASFGMPGASDSFDGDPCPDASFGMPGASDSFDVGPCPDASFSMPGASDSFDGGPCSDATFDISGDSDSFGDGSCPDATYDITADSDSFDDGSCPNATFDIPGAGGDTFDISAYSSSKAASPCPPPPQQAPAPRPCPPQRPPPRAQPCPPRRPPIGRPCPPPRGQPYPLRKAPVSRPCPPQRPQPRPQPCPPRRPPTARPCPAPRSQPYPLRKAPVSRPCPPQRPQPRPQPRAQPCPPRRPTAARGSAMNLAQQQHAERMRLARERKSGAPCPPRRPPPSAQPRVQRAAPCPRPRAPPPQQRCPLASGSSYMNLAQQQHAERMRRAREQRSGAPSQTCPPRRPPPSAQPRVQTRRQSCPQPRAPPARQQCPLASGSSYMNLAQQQHAERIRSAREQRACQWR